MTNRPSPRHLAARWMGVLLAATGVSVAAPVHLPEPTLGTHWYSISILGNRSGWSEQTMRATPRGYETLERTLLRVQLDGRTLTSSRTETRQFDQDCQLVSVEHEADQIGRRTHIEAVRDKGTLRLTRRDPDGEKTQELALPANFGHDLDILQALTDQQIKPGWTQTFSTLDCDLAAIDEITVTILEHVTAPTPGWLFEAHSKLLNVKTRSWMDEQGVILRQEVPTMMGMRMDLVTQEQAMAELEPFLLSSSVPIEAELGRPQGLTRVRLQVTNDGHPAADVFPDTARQSMALVDGAAVLTVQAGLEPATSGQLPFAGPELTPFLEPSDLAPSQDPRLVSQAREIIGEERGAWAAARKLLWWVNAQVHKVQSEPRPLSALEVLDCKRGDCTEHAVLFAALCQAVGLPARMAAGLAYSGRAYHYHAWNEIYVGQWVEMDATWGEETVDAGHLQIASTALDSASIGRMSLASSRSMGTLKLKVLDFEPQP